MGADPTALPAAVCLLGPTASGKTDIALRLCKRFPFAVISVDSALVYRGMDIGTAKPDPATLARVPHRLIDIRDPEESYSAGDFVRDAKAAIAEIVAAGEIPLLVGGTMLYFRALTEGIAELPAADPAARRQIDEEALARGWPAMHARLAAVDPVTAARLNPNDSQRIQRALEVHAASGRPISAWQCAAGDAERDCGVRFLKIGLWPQSRNVLHRRIEERLDRMLEEGLLDEIRTLMRRPGLDRDRPSMRAVGYRQLWAYLAGECSLEEGRYRALVATRQLAKRQFTWLRSERELKLVDPLETDCTDHIFTTLMVHGLNPG